MANTTNLIPQNFSEVYGQVIGLYGDPTNQDLDADGVLLSEAFEQYITWSGASDLQKYLFWSRVLICAILNPFDTHNRRIKVALVMKPRSLWLFDDGGNLSDYVGNSVSVANVGTANADGLITSINPRYNYGDYIRIGTLPSALSVSNWRDDFTAIANEYYDSANEEIRISSLSVSNMTVKASIYGILGVTNFSVSKIVYYDKNVDARTRIVGGGDSGGSFTLPLCVGGVTRLYQIKGNPID